MTIAETTPPAGAQCPRCSKPLPADTQTGQVFCPHCLNPFEATFFNPPVRLVRKAELAVATGPEGSSVCANHERNAAVTNCQRCGLFICALCEMNIDGQSYCPSCFDRQRAEGSLKVAVTRYRDYTATGRIVVILGALLSFACLGLPGIPFGIGGMYCAVKGRRQRKEEGRSTAGPILVFIFGLLEMLGGLALFGFMIWGMTQS